MEAHRDNRIAQFPHLDHAELDRRLRDLEWPGPSAAVKERGLDAIRRAMEIQRDAVDAQAPVERTLCFEVTRWRPASHAKTWSAPRRQPRFATSL